MLLTNYTARMHWCCLLTADVLRCVETVCDPNLNLGWWVGDEKLWNEGRRSLQLLRRIRGAEMLNESRSTGKLLECTARCVCTVATTISLGEARLGGPGRQH